MDQSDLAPRRRWRRRPIDRQPGSRRRRAEHDRMRTHIPRSPWMQSSRRSRATRGLPMGHGPSIRDRCLFSRSSFGSSTGRPAWPDREPLVAVRGARAPMLVYALLHLPRLRGETQSTRSNASASTAASPPGHPATRPYAWRRDHHRPARPGAPPTASAWRSPSATSPPSSATCVDHTTCVLASDADLMEGTARSDRDRRPSQAAQADRVVRRDNGISIDAPLALRPRWTR